MILHSTSLGETGGSENRRWGENPVLNLMLLPGLVYQPANWYIQSMFCISLCALRYKLDLTFVRRRNDILYVSYIICFI